MVLLSVQPLYLEQPATICQCTTDEDVLHLQGHAPAFPPALFVPYVEQRSLAEPLAWVQSVHEAQAPREGQLRDEERFPDGSRDAALLAHEAQLP
jgi:hypothetical protein